jgi:hypothetical protein
MMADVTLACGTRSIGLSEDPPYVARGVTHTRVCHTATRRWYNIRAVVTSD